MRRCVWVLGVVLVVSGLPCVGQKAGVRRPVEPAGARTPEPTLEETFQWIRGKLLALSAFDGYNDVLEVALTPEGELKTTFGDRSTSTTYLKCLNLSSMTWDVFEPYNEKGKFPKVLRLTTVGECTPTVRLSERAGGPETRERGYYRLLFSLAKASDVPDFQARMERAWTRLVLLSGGKQGAQF